MREFMQIIRENDLAAHVAEVDDDGDVPHARAAFFGEEDDSGQDAMIRYWNTPYGVVLQAMHSNQQFRGRDMLRWLVNKYGSVNVVECIPEAYDFWRKMKREGLVRTIEDAEGGPSEQEADAIPFTQPLSGGLNENYYDRVPQRYDTKPAYMVRYEDEEGGDMPVWENPSNNTFHRIINNGHGSARGLILADGRLLVWDTADLYHSDVAWNLETSGQLAMQFYPTEVAIKGESEEEQEYHGEHEALIRKAVRRYYPENVSVLEFNWG